MSHNSPRDWQLASWRCSPCEKKKKKAKGKPAAQRTDSAACKSGADTADKRIGILNLELETLDVVLFDSRFIGKQLDVWQLKLLEFIASCKIVSMYSLYSIQVQRSIPTRPPQPHHPVYVQQQGIRKRNMKKQSIHT